MHVSEFPYCCGAKVLCKFGHTDCQVGRVDYSPEQIEQFIKDAVLTYYNHQLIALINEDQYPIVSPILRKHGFKRKASFLYSGHNNVIYTYIRLPE